MGASAVVQRDLKMPGLYSGQATNYGFRRSAIMLLACCTTVALMLLPVALPREGSAGPIGLGIAGAICLVSALAAECLGHIISRFSSPLAGQLLGMCIRMFLPLTICLVLAVKGFSGRENLAFVCYLLSFYATTLMIETQIAVKRVAGHSVPVGQSAR